MFEFNKPALKPRATEPDVQKEGTCPKCSARMIKNFSTISGNAKYITWMCESCGHKETKCLGILK